jgi:hypothetical protein
MEDVESATVSRLITFFKSQSFWFPTVCVIAFLAVVVVVFQTGDLKYQSLSRGLSQWDGQHYLSIARDGYEKYSCYWNTSYICGNIGWFPFYPLTGRLVALTGISINWSLIISSWVALWLALLILYRLVESKYDRTTAVYATLALLLFPTSFYFATGFPYSLYLLLATLTFYLIHKEQYPWLMLLTGFLAVTYPSGSVIGLPIAYHLLRNWKKLTNVGRMQLLGAMAFMGVAILTYFTYNYLKFGDFFLYLTYQHQSFYGHHLSFPLITIYSALTNLPADHPHFLITVLTVGVVVLTYSRRLDIESQLLMFGILLFTPTFGTLLCYYRHIVVAFPLFVMIGLAANCRWRRYLVAIYAVVSLVLAWEVFVPAFKKGLLM